MNRLFPMLNPSEHLVQADVKTDDNSSKFMVILEGYHHPFIAQWWSLNTRHMDLFLYKEICMTRRTLEENLIDVLSNSEKDNFFAILIDKNQASQSGFGLMRHIIDGDDTKSKFKDVDKSVKRGMFIIENALLDGKLHFFKDALIKEDLVLKGHGYPTDTYQSLQWATYIESEKGIEFGNLHTGFWATIYAVNYCFNTMYDELEKEKQDDTKLVLPPKEETDGTTE